MKLALDTLKAVGDKANDRAAVSKQLLEETKNRQSVLGEYSIDKNGDTSLTDYGLYVIKGGEPTFSKVIKATDGRQLADRLARRRGDGLPEPVPPPLAVGSRLKVEAASASIDRPAVATL